jgi:hypothetical protein
MWNSEHKALFLRDAAEDAGGVLAVYIDNLHLLN